MKCKYCGLAIHKCSSANEYHADDRAEYMKELNGSGCIHQPATPPNKACSRRVPRRGAKVVKSKSKVRVGRTRG